MKLASTCAIILLHSIATKAFFIQPPVDAFIIQQQTPYVITPTSNHMRIVAATTAAMAPAPSTKLFASTNLPSDYEARAKAFGFASPKDVVKAMKEPDVMILDVRTKAEIESQGGVDSPGAKHVYSNCTPGECPELEIVASDLLPDKTATIVIHCASGKRAAKAQETLEKQGYKHVLNAGSLQDFKAILGQP